MAYSHLTYYKPETRSAAVAIGSHYTTVFFLSTERNAYNYTWNCRYVWGEAHWGALVDAKRCAERQRVQGTRFYIKELPAIAFPYMNGRRALIITELSSSSPLSVFKKADLPSNRISSIAKTFKPDIGGSVICLSGNARPVSPKQPLIEIQSRSMGGGYLLSWIPIESTAPSNVYKGDCVLLAKRLNKSLERVK
jgi:hypothetical protein